LPNAENRTAGIFESTRGIARSHAASSGLESAAAMNSITDLLILIGTLFCALSCIAPEAVANYSRARWVRAGDSMWTWKRMFSKFVLKPWYPTFVRVYGLFGLVYLLIYLVFFRFSK
jgi:hypothetical protein